MATITVYDLAVTSGVRMIDRTSEILTKGEAYGKENNISESTMLTKRLVDDQAAIPFQIQRLCDTFKFIAVRVADVQDAPTFEDKETTFAELQERLAATKKFLLSIPKEKFEAVAADKEITHTYMKGSMTPVDYLLVYAIPNGYFHVTTAYSILRLQGVPVGKKDFIGRVEVKWASP